MTINYNLTTFCVFLLPQEFSPEIRNLRRKSKFQLQHVSCCPLLIKLSNLPLKANNLKNKEGVPHEDTNISLCRSILFMYKLWLRVHYMMCNVYYLCEIISMLDRGNDH